MSTRLNHADVARILIDAGIGVMDFGCESPECSSEPDWINSDRVVVMFGTLNTTEATKPAAISALKSAGLRTRRRGEDIVVARILSESPPCAGHGGLSRCNREPATERRDLRDDARDNCPT